MLLLHISGKPEHISAEYAQHAYREWYDVLRFFSDWNNKLFSISLTEYNELPAILLDAKRTYDAVVNRMDNKDK